MLALVRKIDELGRIGIPKQILKRYGFGDKSVFELYIDEQQDRICLKILPKSCAICGCSENTQPVPGIEYKWLCPRCLKTINGMMQHS